ncbi:homoserine dehydrogenase [Olsenella porci]|jgi:homoserine dehydrogenase|uniref:Homoserine dehydrogenase n=1 Tax=Olsenella porci TaxID=2652279 RepID=A0A6N7XLS5_9ACTN|nr:homoserine dehydrogenase [Olsenella porci]MCI1997573.1 homoserine dehydrogenase [Olsenella sp.]MST72188.1 homoserine dehydrogenase [Olsenella porci]
MKIAILGHGVVGRGVDRIVTERVEGVEVSRILELPDRLTDPRMTSNFQDIVDDPEISLVVECMGGIEPAHTFIMDALSAGKSVVTSNKAVVAEHFGEFVSQANFSHAGLYIEATCGGGIPWIASILKARRIDDISSISGIMNGTTNYIVDAMVREGADFDVVLAEAQRLGYAERDPSADIDGIDVRNKTIIASSVAFDTTCTGSIPVTGIRTLTKADLDLFESRGLSVKLLGRAVQGDGRYAAAVEPVAVPLRSLEANVPSNFNLCTLVGTTVGELKFYGQGAGSLPTGNAIVQDILDFSEGRVPHYDIDTPKQYDPTLLTSDYVIRTSSYVEDSEPYAEDFEFVGGDRAFLLRGITAEKAHEAFVNVLDQDPSSFMAAIARED